MKRLISAFALAGLCATGVAFAATTAPKTSVPVGHATVEAKAKKVTVTCGDGTTYTGTHPKKGCKKHGGVKS